ncbi:MAG: hypothetical protein PVSMB1_06280 [Gemmatimonadaceae bacterium]
MPSPATGNVVADTCTQEAILLRSTPNAYYPEPTAANRLREAEATFNVEYIDVNHTTAALDEYRDAMRRVIGPP